MPRSKLVSAALVALFLVSIAVPVHAAIDSTLYARYFFNFDKTNVYFVVCGSLTGSSGCYGSGSMGPFGRTGAILEGNASTNLKTNTVTRPIYVLDVAYGTAGTGVALYVYKKTDTITGSFDSVAISLQKVVPLPLTGGADALASMAANAKFVYVGTNLGSGVVRVLKSNLTYVQPGGLLGGIAAITADKNGHIAVTQGTFNSGGGGLWIFDADGNGLEEGGGSAALLNSTQALLPPTLP